MSPFYSRSELSPVRERAQMVAQGYYAENFPRMDYVVTSLPTTGTVYFQAIGLAAGDVVTNLNLLCNVLGSGFSGVGMKVGLYTKALAPVAASGDVSALFGSVGPKICPMSAPYTVPTTDGYFTAIIVVATTTPSLARGAPSSFASGAFTGAQAAYGFQNGQTDLPASPTLTFNNNANPYWVGVS